MKSINVSHYSEHLLLKKSLITIFSETVMRFPQKNALMFRDEQISYADLDTRSNAMADLLLKKQIGKGDIVAVFLPRGIELFTAILGILKSGAAYIPFDIDTPAERIIAVMQEVQTSHCISLRNLGAGIDMIDPIREGYDQTPAINLSEPDELAYIIFTSGSTGKPKGIPIRHFQIAHLIQSENSVLQIQEEDIVYQGFSVSFDMWLEEVWISFLVGATLCIADDITAKSFDVLDQFMRLHGITVLHAVPSLLALLHPEIPQLRIVNSGGEACTQNVLEKWARPGIRFFNSYGPTETTVTASMIQLHQGDEISIGYPLPNYSMAVVNEEFEALPVGEQGELVIAGLGLSDGYLHRPDLSASSFLKKPDELQGMFGERIYLTGDLGYMMPDGRFKISGRKDEQVKIRGYRVELGEIAATLNSLEQVNAAAVISKKINGIDQLVAYVLMDEGTFDEQHVREQLLSRLPAYMVPSLFVQVKGFSYLPSGKIDKKQLPEPIADSQDGSTDRKAAFAYDPFMQELASILVHLFPGQPLKLDSDFFEDLGGHSMLAALFVSEVRALKGLSNISIIDIYQHKKLDLIFQCWKEKSLQQTKPPESPNRFNKISPVQYYACWLAQTIALFFIYGLVAAQIFIPYLGYYIAANEWGGHFWPIVVSILLFCLVTPLFIIGTVLFKKWVIGTFKEGIYPLWGSYYFKWWFYQRLLDIIPVDTISSTPLYPSFLSKIGLHTAPDAQISKVQFGCADLITIGKNVTISANVMLNNAQVKEGILYLKKIDIQDHAYIGTGSVINGGCCMETGSSLKELSCLKEDTRIPAYECWEGSPAVFFEKQQPAPLPVEQSRKKRIKYRFVFLAVILTFPVLIVLPLVPSILGLHYLDEQADWYSFTYLLSSPLFALVYIVLFLLELILLSRLIRTSIVEGRFPVYSTVYIKKWFSDQLFSLSLYVIRPIFATVYIPPIYRALGAKVGRNTEISNASNVTHHLLEIGSESFIADVAVIGESDIRNQELILQKTSIGNKSFVGNSALIPQGYHVGDNKLIGVLSVPPAPEKIANDIPSDWFGSPAIQLPNREIRNDYPDELTFRPGFWRRCARAMVELIRILIPQSVIFCLSILFIAYSHDLLTEGNSVLHILFLFPFYYIGIVAIPAFLFTVIIKWLLIGKYKNAEYPMWTPQVWITEAVTSFYEALAVPFCLHFLQGTPYLPALLRWYGVKIGKRVWMDTTDITEFDMVNIGDDCALNTDSGPQTHLFEDRVMKIGRVEIGAYSSIGAGSIILYHSKLEAGCCIDPLSLVMKGEHLPANTKWCGIPIRQNISSADALSM